MQEMTIKDFEDISIIRIEEDKIIFKCNRCNKTFHEEMAYISNIEDTISKVIKYHNLVCSKKDVELLIEELDKKMQNTEYNAIFPTLVGTLLIGYGFEEIEHISFISKNFPHVLINRSGYYHNGNNIYVVIDEATNYTPHRDPTNYKTHYLGKKTIHVRIYNKFIEEVQYCEKEKEVKELTIEENDI